MIIVGQEKDKIIVFEQMASLYVDTWNSEEWATEPDCFCIKAEKASDNLICMFLGQYKTEERAKEVLQEIITRYKNWENMKIGQPTGLCLPVYEMPKE